MSRAGLPAGWDTCRTCGRSYCPARATSNIAKMCSYCAYDLAEAIADAHHCERCDGGAACLFPAWHMPRLRGTRKL